MSSQPDWIAPASVVPYALDFEKPITQMERELQRLELSQVESGRDYSEQIRAIREQLQNMLREAYAKLTPWQRVLVARHPARPLLRDYIRILCKDFCELYGDKQFSDDKALVCGFARLAGHKVMLVGQHKGRGTAEKIETRFGCANPDGYRKALQKMKLAAKFRVPIVSLIDTQGAHAGVEAEERGIARAIAVNLMEMSRLPVPIVAVVIGEGGSGGALGIAVADHVAAMENAYYSVISPEGCAAILWKDGQYAPKAAEALRIIPSELLRLKLIDEVIPEPLGAAHRDPEGAARNLERSIREALDGLKRVRSDTLLKRRYERLRKLGSFFESRSSGTVEPRPRTIGKARTRRTAPNGLPASA